MKKYFIMLVMLFTMSVYSFAEDNNATEIEKFEKYDFRINNRKLANFLELSEDQMESVETVTDAFSNEMKFAFYENKNEARQKVVNNIVKKNIKHMAYILNEEQYHKYLRVLNVSLNNRGFSVIY